MVKYFWQLFVKLSSYCDMKFWVKEAVVKFSRSLSSLLKPFLEIQLVQWCKFFLPSCYQNFLIFRNYFSKNLMCQLMFWADAMISVRLWVWQNDALTLLCNIMLFVYLVSCWIWLSSLSYLFLLSSGIVNISALCILLLAVCFLLSSFVGALCRPP